VLGLWLDSILKVSSNLNDSVIPYKMHVILLATGKPVRITLKSNESKEELTKKYYYTMII